MVWVDPFCSQAVPMAQGVLQLLFLGQFTGKRPKWGWFLLLPALLCMGSILEAQFRLPFLTLALDLLALYGICRRESGPLVSCAAVALAACLGRLSFGLADSLQALLLPLAGDSPALLAGLAVLGGLLSLGACAACYALTARYFPARDARRGPDLWILLPPLLFFWAAESYLCFTGYGNTVAVPAPAEPGKQAALLAWQLLGLGALFCFLYACRRTRENWEAQAALVNLEREARIQRACAEQAMVRYERTKAFRHDVKNHLTVLDTLLAEGDTARARGYLEKLQASADRLSLPVRTGDPVVDAVLGEKLALAGAEGVEVQLSLTLPPSCRADGLDLCVIFSNALDNAIRACKEVSGKRWIRIGGRRQGDFLLLEFENSCASPGDFRPGTGLSNIRAAAERYGGAAAAEKKENSFRLSVLLNISEHPEDSSGQIP